MTAFKSKEELLSSINKSFEAINQGKVDIATMDELVNCTRQLYERTLIIRHKALELFVAEKPLSFEKDLTSDTSSIDEKEITPKVEETSSIIPEEEMTAQEKTIETKHSEPTFSVKDKEEDFAFDLFGSEELIDSPKTEVHEEFIPEVEIEREEEANVELPKKIGDIMRENSADLSVDRILEEEVQILEEKEKEEEREENKTKNSIPTSTNTPSFFTRYNTIADNPSAQMIAPKIESLTTAFGLGEKLMYIRELFNGSSDSFDQTVKSVENVNSFEEAKNILNNIAHSNNWNLEEQATLDFVNKVERRFF
jgi:hypothetical protein